MGRRSPARSAAWASRPDRHTQRLAAPRRKRRGAVLVFGHDPAALHASSSPAPTRPSRARTRRSPSAPARPSSASRTRSRSSTSRRPGSTRRATRSSRSRCSSRAAPRCSSATHARRPRRAPSRRDDAAHRHRRRDGRRRAHRRRGAASASPSSWATATSSRTTRDFDRAFLAESASPHARALPGAWLDSLELARIALPRLSLAPAARPRRGVRPAAATRAHRARRRRRGARSALWRVCLAGARGPARRGASRRSRASRRDVDWPLRRVLAHVAAAPARAAARPEAPAPRARARRARRGAARRRRLRPRRAPSPTRCSREFSAEGLVGRMYPGFEQRGEQLEMAEAVLDAFGGAHAPRGGGGHRRRQVGGVPRAGGAVRAAQPRGRRRGDEDERAHGPARVRRAARAGRGARRQAALRGAEGLRALPLPAQARPARARARASRTARRSRPSRRCSPGRRSRAWGELDALNVHWPPGLRRRWRARPRSARSGTAASTRTSATSAACARRRRARTSSSRTTRCSSATRPTEGGILPPLRYWVVDEAHSAEAEARRQLSRRRSRSVARGRCCAACTRRAAAGC